MGCVLLPIFNCLHKDVFTLTYECKRGRSRPLSSKKSANNCTLHRQVRSPQFAACVFVSLTMAHVETPVDSSRWFCFFDTKPLLYSCIDRLLTGAPTVATRAARYFLVLVTVVNFCRLVNVENLDNGILLYINIGRWSQKPPVSQLQRGSYVVAVCILSTRIHSVLKPIVH